MRTYKKGGMKMENIRNFKIFKNEKEETEMKVKWSLKKKLIIAGGVVGTAVLGVFAYGKSHNNDIDNELNEDLNEMDFEDETELEDEILEDEIKEIMWLTF